MAAAPDDHDIERDLDHDLDLDDEVYPRWDCPSCGQHAVVPVIFGMADWQLGRRAERGDVVLGGCCLDPGYTGREVECTACGWLGQEKKDGTGIIKRRMQRIY